MPYVIFTTQFYEAVCKDLKGRSLIAGDHPGYELWQEKCFKNGASCYDGLDRYGLCCFIYKNKVPIIKVRYAGYPWTATN